MVACICRDNSPRSPHSALHNLWCHSPPIPSQPVSHSGSWPEWTVQWWHWQSTVLLPYTSAGAFPARNSKEWGTCRSWCLAGQHVPCFPVSSVSHHVSDLCSQSSALPQRHWWAWHLHKYRRCTRQNGISESEDCHISSVWCSLCLALVRTWYHRKHCMALYSWSYICKVCRQHSFPFCSGRGRQWRMRPRQRSKEWPGGDGRVLPLVGTGGMPTGSSRWGDLTWLVAVEVRMPWHSERQECWVFQVLWNGLWGCPENF